MSPILLLASFYVFMLRKEYSTLTWCPTIYYVVPENAAGSVSCYLCWILLVCLFLLLSGTARFMPSIKLGFRAETCASLAFWLSLSLANSCRFVSGKQPHLHRQREYFSGRGAGTFHVCLFTLMPFSCAFTCTFSFHLYSHLFPCTFWVSLRSIPVPQCTFSVSLVFPFSFHVPSSFTFG